jgi:hypothetical protein
MFVQSEEAPFCSLDSSLYFQTHVIRWCHQGSEVHKFFDDFKVFVANCHALPQRLTDSVRDAYLALEREAAKVGLKINDQKTKYMIAARNDMTNRDMGQSVAIGDKHFEVVKEFLYLGSLMTPTNDVSLEIQRRIQTANRCFFGLHKHLQSSHLSRQTLFTIHKTLIRPVLLYGSET